MLIKNCTLDGKVFIIDGVNDVVVGSGTYDYNDRYNKSPDESEPCGWGDWGDNPPYFFQEEHRHEIIFVPCNTKTPPDKETAQDCKLVYYTKDGKGFRLLVFGTAYICNDDGKTIEIVKVKKYG